MGEKENTLFEIQIAENRREPELFDIFLEETLRHYFENVSILQRDATITGIKKEVISLLQNDAYINSISSIKIIDDYLVIQGLRDMIFYLGGNRLEQLSISWPELQTKIDTHKKKISESVEKVERYIDALDSIFKGKSSEWFGNLGEQDKVTSDAFGGEMKGKNPIQIQKEIDSLFFFIDTSRVKDSKMHGYIQKSRERYFRMLMGVGNVYERGADFFPKKKEKMLLMGATIIKDKSISECFDFLYQIHKEMYENTYKSSQVKQSYKSVAEIFHASLFQKLVEQDASDELFLHLAKLVSGRSGKIIKVDDGTGGEVEVTEGYIYSELLDSKLSNKIIMHIFTKKGGVIERMESSKKFQIVDEEATKELPSKIVKRSKEVLDKYIIMQKDVNSESYLKSMGCDCILGIKENTKYEDLDLEQRAALSLLVRLNKKIVQKAHPVKYQESYNEFGAISVGTEGEATEAVNIQEILEEVRHEAFTAVSESIANNTKSGVLGRTTKSAKELGFTGTDAEIYNLFVDIQGNGLFNLSDDSIEWNKAAAKTLGGIAVILGTAVAAGFFLPVTVVGGIVVGVTASVASIGTEFAIHGKGFETPSEAIVDMGSDILVGGATGGLGGKVLQGGVTKIFRSEISGKYIFGIEIVGLGFIPEMGRQWAIDKKFREKSIFTAH